jgi:hypothetical protein
MNIPEPLDLSHSRALSNYIRSERFRYMTRGNLFNGAPQAGLIVSLVSLATLAAMVLHGT